MLRQGIQIRLGLSPREDWQDRLEVVDESGRVAVVFRYRAENPAGDSIGDVPITTVVAVHLSTTVVIFRMKLRLDDLAPQTLNPVAKPLRRDLVERDLDVLAPGVVPMDWQADDLVETDP